MLRTLRRRLILSHVLPLLNLTHGETEDAGLTAEIASNQTDIWRDHAQAQNFLDRQKPYVAEPMDG